MVVNNDEQGFGKVKQLHLFLVCDNVCGRADEAGAVEHLVLKRTKQRERRQEAFPA